jgi:hypothetical protein
MFIASPEAIVLFSLLQTQLSRGLFPALGSLRRYPNPMKSKAHHLAAWAVFGLVACSSSFESERHEASIIAPGNFKAGSGEITQVGVLRKARPDDGSKDRNLYRLYLRMDAPAGTQSVDVDRSHFMVGEFVEITNDGRVVRVSGTSLNEALRKAGR